MIPGTCAFSEDRSSCEPDRKLETGHARQGQLPGTADRRNGPGRNGISLKAEVKGHATTGLAGPSSEIFWTLRSEMPGGTDRSVAPVYASTCLPAGRADQGWGGRLSACGHAQADRRAVRRTTCAAAERPRHRAGREAHGAGVLQRWERDLPLPVQAEEHVPAGATVPGAIRAAPVPCPAKLQQ